VGYHSDQIIMHIERVFKDKDTTVQWYQEDPKCLTGTLKPVVKALKDFNHNPFWLLSADLFIDFGIVPSKPRQSQAHLMCLEDSDQPDFNLINGRVDDRRINAQFSGIARFSPLFFEHADGFHGGIGDWLRYKSSNTLITGEFILKRHCTNVTDLKTLESLNLLHC